MFDTYSYILDTTIQRFIHNSSSQRTKKSDINSSLHHSTFGIFNLNPNTVYLSMAKPLRQLHKVCQDMYVCLLRICFVCTHVLFFLRFVCSLFRSNSTFQKKGATERCLLSNTIPSHIQQPQHLKILPGKGLSLRSVIFR